VILRLTVRSQILPLRITIYNLKRNKNENEKKSKIQITDNDNFDVIRKHIWAKPK